MVDWRDDPSTDRQCEYAKDLGVIIPDGATKGEASDIIDEAKTNKDISVRTGSIFRRINNRIILFSKSLLSKVLTLIEIIIVMLGVYCFIKERNGLGITCIVGLIAMLYFHRIWLYRNGYVFSGVVAGTKKHKPEPIHGKKGSFDESYFVNPKTGKFQFPKYKHDNKYLVKITDETDYKELWEDYDAEEKRDYNLYEFEINVDGCIEIEVEPIETIFYKSSTSHLAPLTYLNGKWSLVQDILSQKDDEWLTIDADKDIMSKLLQDGYLFERVVASDADKLQYFQTFNLPILRDACKEAGLNLSHMNKRKIVDEMIAFKKQLNLPSAVIRSPKFDEWYDGLVQLYINDIKENARRFHPLYHKGIWISVLEQDESNISKVVDEIISSEYWNKNLCK